MQKGAAEFPEPDETVVCGVSNLGLPAWLYGAFPGRYLLIGDQKLWLAANRKVHARARAILAAASGQHAGSESVEVTARCGNGFAMDRG
jgi:hypothetical protein